MVGCQSQRSVPRSHDAGVAAIEFVLTVPVLLILFLGMIDITHYAWTTHKVKAAAELAADLVSRHTDTIDDTDIDDYAIAARLLFKPASPALDVVIYNYAQNATGTFNLRWSRPASGAACGAPNIDKSRNGALARQLANSDLIVAVTCLSYQPPVPVIPMLQNTVFSPLIVSQMSGRPRQSNTLVCATC